VWPAKFGSEMGVKKPLVELMKFGSGETTRQSWNGPQQLFNVIFLTVSTGGDQLWTAPTNSVKNNRKEKTKFLFFFVNFSFGWFLVF
jgi:hypothetical protein